MLTQAACIDIAKNDNLQGFDLRVFIFLNGILDEENWLSLHHAAVARQMSTDDDPNKVKRQQVTRSINRLVAENIIMKGENRTYRLHPGVGWKGDMAQQSKAKSEAAAGRLSLVKF